MDKSGTVVLCWFRCPLPLSLWPSPCQGLQGKFDQVGSSGDRRPGSSSQPLASSMPLFGAAPKPMPAFLPVQSERPMRPHVQPLPLPVVKDATFYANYPLDNGSGASVAPVEETALPASSLRPSAVIPTSTEWRPPPGSGFVSSRAQRKECSAIVLTLFLQPCTLL